MLGALLVLLTGFLPLFLYRVAYDTGGTDFPEFHAAGRYVLEHRQRHPDSILHRYLPSVDVAWALLGCMPRLVAAVVWYVVSCLTLLGLLRSVGRYLLPSTPQGDRRIVLLAAGLLAVVFTLDHLLLGAFHILMLWLMVAGVARVMVGRERSGAALLGLAVWLKLLPLIGVLYLALKRRWQAVGISLVAALVVDVILSAAAYGPTAAWSAHVAWWHTRAVGDLGTLLGAPAFCHQMSERNQSLPAVMRRTLTHVAVRHKDPAYRRVAMADVSSRQLKALYFALTVAGAVLLAWYWRKPPGRLTPDRWAGEVAVVALATLWFSPIVYSYHPTAALPALAVVLGTHWEASRLKRVALLVWILAAVLLAVPVARALGESLWASLFLGATVALATGRSGPATAR